MATQLELYHHGVKGMKWGIRKDRGINSPDRVRERKRKRDLQVKYFRSQSRGKRAAKVALQAATSGAFNPYGYDRMRSQGHSRVESVAVSSFVPFYSAYSARQLTAHNRRNIVARNLITPYLSFSYGGIESKQQRDNWIGK